ncbi:hypothetical protein BpJC7_21700 [Weizmannia acidilactici]|uniref:Uncharacterized protein n=1 Tax=Weizmannia acidilactici TaxID=2607726 RepID=A0A5J4JKJ0_9BACI|nr:hypothetical protein BpJC7_21700 [Weizmannia acidilactici]
MLYCMREPAKGETSAKVHGNEGKGEMQWLIGCHYPQKNENSH